jgi:hypothetical protein
MADTGEPEAVPDADVELYKRLREAGHTELAWNLAETEFFDYGWSVLLAWLNSGLIARKCQEKGRPVRLPEYWSAEDREDVAAVAVGDGLAMFRQAVEADVWHPSLGASLKTYFLGGCVLAFPNALRLWRRYGERHRRATAELARQADLRRQQISAVSVVESVEAVEMLVRDENARNQAIMTLVAFDHTPAEIAEVLRMKPATVHARMSRLRGKYREGRAE